MIGRILRRLPLCRTLLRRLTFFRHRRRLRPGRPIFGIDTPVYREPMTPYLVHCSGWLHLGDAQEDLESVALVLEGTVLAESRRLLRRPDVDKVLGLPKGTRTGFHLMGSGIGVLEPGPHPVRPTLVYRLRGTTGDHRLCTVNLWIVDGDKPALKQPYGSLLDPELDQQLGRSDVYTTGAPDPLASDRCVELLLQEFDPGASVLDLGCGAGAYGTPLMDAGHIWLGVEGDPATACLASESGLPVLVANVVDLELADGAFDHVIAIEVIEHLDDPEAFIRQAARLANHSAVFSVPNSAAIPLLHPYVVTPWHLMEADHKSFFTPTNLTQLLEQHFEQVEVVPYGDLPIRTPEGARIFYHLLAVCRNGDSATD